MGYNFVADITGLFLFI